MKAYAVPLLSLLALCPFTCAAAVAQDAAAGTGAQPLDTAARCRAMTAVHLAGAEITRSERVPAAPPGTVPWGPFTHNTIPVALPGHCRVAGVIGRRRGADGVEYGIGFLLRLPDNWNRRLLFLGGSAFNGDIGETLGLLATGTEPALARGFAILATDGGHKGAPFDVSFTRDQQAALDFAFNAVPTETRVGQDIVAAYFGRAPHHTYGDGCSTGGREGMLAAERYPSLFDGIIVGDPAMRSGNTRLSGWNAEVAFNRISPRQADGKPLRLRAFPAADQKLLAAAVARACDALDGLQDGLILNLAACRFDPAVLQCKAGKSPDCLSAAQVGALKRAFGALRDRRGELIYPGFPYDLGLLGEHVGNPMSRIPTSGPDPYNTPPSPFSLDVEAEWARLRSDALETLTDTASWADLGTFYRRGGKIIFYHGASDPWYSIYDTLDYVQRNKRANPEFDSSRFYVVPGMGHCGQGGLEGFDMLNALVDWVEKDIAPAAIMATDFGQPGRRRPLCPWPQYGHYKGSGDPNDPANFECRSP